MFGRVKIVYDTHDNTHMVPKVAIISEDETQSVFVIKDSLAFKESNTNRLRKRTKCRSTKWITRGRNCRYYRSR